MAARRRKVEFVLAGVDRLSRVVRGINGRVGSMVAPINRLRRAADRLGRTEGFKRLRNAVARVGRVLRGLAIGGVAALAAAAVGIARFVSTGDSLAKTARAIGLNVEALQELQFAGDREGVSAESLTKGLTDFAKRLGEAKAGTGALFTLLKRTNPQLLRQLTATESVEEAFNLYADAIARTEDPLKDAALANAAFGRAGKQMVNVLNLGRDGIADLRKEARGLGLSLSNEAAPIVEKINDQFGDLRQAVGAFAGRVVEALLPAVQSILGGMLAWVDANRAWLDPALTKFGQDLANTIRSIAAFVVDAVPKVAAFVKGMGGFKTIAIVAGAALVGTAVAIAAVLAPLVLLGAKATLIAGVIGLAAAKVLQHWEPIRDFFVGLPDVVAAAVNKALGFVQRIARFIPGLGGLGTALELGGRLFGGGGQEVSAPGAGTVAAPAGATVSGQIGVQVGAEPGTRARITRFEGGGDLDLSAEMGPVLAGAM